MKENIIFKSETLIPVIQDAIKYNCSVLLVKDQGLHMMPIRGITLCYAEGFSPDRQESDEWRERLNTLCGENDRVEEISAQHSALQSAINDRSDIAVSFSDKEIAITALK